MDSITFPQVESIQSILLSILSPDNTLRKNQESLLQSFHKSYPNEFTICLLKTLESSQNHSLKILSSILLRHTFTSNPHNPSQYSWKLLTSETKLQTISSLLQSLKNESSFFIAKKIAETISELGILLFSGDCPSGWPDLLDYIITSFDSNPNQLSSSMYLLCGLCSFFHEDLIMHQESLIKVCIDNLESAEFQLQISTIDFLTKFMCLLDEKEMLGFFQVVPSYLRAVIKVLNASEKDGEDALKNLRDLAETEPRYFVNKLNLAWEFFELVFESGIENMWIKSMGLDFIVALTGELKQEFLGNLPLCDALCQNVFKLMMSIDCEVEDSWASPYEGFEDNDEDFEVDYAKFTKNHIAKIIMNLGVESILPMFLKIIDYAINIDSSDWRIRYSGLMGLSEIIQFVQGDKKIIEIINILQKHAGYDNPKIRYAVFICLSQIKDACYDNFQMELKEIIGLMIANGLRDPVNRVKAEALNTLGKIVEKWDLHFNMKILTVIMPIIINFISLPNCSLVIECALCALDSISKLLKENFSIWSTQTIPYLLNLLSNYTTYEYQQLQGKAIDCISTINSYVEKTVLIKYSHNFIQILIIVQNTQIAEKNHIKKPIICAWQQLAIVLSHDFSHYIKDMLSGFFYEISLETKTYISLASEENFDLQNVLETPNKKGYFEAEDIEENCVVLESLYKIIEALKEIFAPYVEDTARFLLCLLGYKVDVEIKKVALKILVLLVDVANIANQDYAVLGKNIINELWEKVIAETDVEGQVSELDAIQNIIENSQMLVISSEEMSHYCEILIKILQKTQARNQRRNFIEDNNENDEEVINLSVSKIQLYIYTSINKIFTILLKTYKDPFLIITNFLISSIINRFLSPEVNDQDYTFAINLINLIIENLNDNLSLDTLTRLIETLLLYSSSINENTRQSSIYGLGLFATHISPTKFSLWSSQILNTLNQSIIISIQNPTQANTQTRNNAIFSLGKIIKYQQINIEINLIVPIWISLFPIKSNPEEAKSIYDILTDICISHPNLVFGTSYENLTLFLNLIIEILNAEICEEGTLMKIKFILKTLEKNALTALQNAMSLLNDMQKDRIIEVING